MPSHAGGVVELLCFAPSQPRTRAETLAHCTATTTTTHTQGAHSGDINSLRWEPSGKLLASCSDDGTVKVWQATSDKPLHSLTGTRWGGAWWLVLLGFGPGSNR